MSQRDPNINEDHPIHSQESSEQDPNEPQEEAQTVVDSATDAASKKDKDADISKEDLKDQLLRSLAEFDNYKKRSEREIQDMAKYAVTNFAKDMLTVSDNFARALQAIPESDLQENSLMKSLCDGIKMTESELHRIFKKHAIMKIDPLREPFNHHEHQAIMEVEDAAQQPGTVVEVLQSGYKIHDRLLRPAMVKVAK